MPVLDRSAVHSLIRMRCRTICILAAFTAGCGNDQPTQPRLPPPSQPNFDFHEIGGPRRRPLKVPSLPKHSDTRSLSCAAGTPSASYCPLLERTIVAVHDTSGP